MTEDQIIDAIIQREGGFVHDPVDLGGATNWGITQQALAAWRKKPVTVEDVRRLTQEEARKIYREQYIARPGFQAICNPQLRALVVDCGVNHGPDDAVRFLQRSLGGLKVDGVLGPKTRTAIEAADPVRLYARVCGERMRHYGRLIQRDPNQHKFAAGWADRVADFLDELPV